ncbi:MAG: MBL fold metallo-hydrolase [Cyanobacteriota bacterium]|nr:MBL fold metallo-hydrolase [Cyanobacteriota bacterium]
MAKRQRLIVMGASHAHSHSENAESPRQQAAATNPDALPAGFPCSLQTDLLKWNDQVVQKDQFGKWKLILLNAEKFHAGNVAILKRGKDVVLIDSGCAKNYEKLVKKITKRDYAPFFLVNTHAHPDHTGANVEMVEEGAIVLAHRNAREHMVGYGVPGESGLPVVTFRRRMTIYAGKQRMRLLSLAPGHTDGDLAVWVPDMNLLHTGDVFMSRDYPLIDSNSGGSILGLIRSVNRLVRRSDRDTVIIPGHGPLAGRKELVQYQNMLVNVTDDVQYHKNLGLDLESVRELNLTKKYDKKWGQGDLITGRQFVGFVYNTLPDATISPSKRELPSHKAHDHDSGKPEVSSSHLFAKRATLEVGEKGRASLSFDLNDRDEGQFDAGVQDRLTGLSSSKTWSAPDLVSDSGTAPSALFSFELRGPAEDERFLNLDGWLKRTSFDDDRMTIEVAFDADDFRSEHDSDRASGLASDGVIDLASVRIDQMESCPLGDI